MNLPRDFPEMTREERVEYLTAPRLKPPPWMEELLADEAELDRRMSDG